MLNSARAAADDPRHDDERGGHQQSPVKLTTLLCVAILLAFATRPVCAGGLARRDSLSYEHIGRVKVGIELSSLELLVAWLGLPPLSFPAADYSFTIPVAALPVEMQLTRDISGFISPTYTIAGAGVWHSIPVVDSHFFIHYLGVTGGACIDRIIRVGAVVLYPDLYDYSQYPDWFSSVHSLYWRKVYVGLMASIGYSGRSFFAGLQINDRFSPDPKGVFMPRYYLSLGVGYYFSTFKLTL